MENIPDVRTFETLREWLNNLTCAYNIYEANTSDPDCLRLISDINETIKQANRLSKKTQLATHQYALLSSRIRRIVKKSPCRTIEAVLCNSSWNQLQVYEGMRSMYAKYLRKVSINMVDCCLQLDNLHESFLDLIIVEEQNSD